MTFATLNGVPIVAGSLIIPLIGMWTADIELATDMAETGAATIVLGNLTLVGTVVRSSPFAGQTRARAVGGAGGWRTQIPAQGYSNSSGVALSMVLNDAALACGETANIPNDTTIGPFYARPADAAVFSLRTFCPAWYVDTSGVTQIAPWPVVVVGSPFTVIDQRTDEGIVTIATEDYASWLPGASFQSDTLNATFQCAGVEYIFDNDGKFRLQVLTDPTADRVLGPLHSIIDRRTSPMRYFGRYRYTISNPTTTTVDATPMDSTLFLPSLQGVPLDSDSISTYVPPSGGECHIMFADGLATMPRVVWTAGTATVCNVLGGSNPVARQADQTQSYLPPTLPIVGVINDNESFTGTITVPNPISGSIVQGSPSVNVP